MGTSSAGFGPPRGMRDFYPEDMAVRTHIFESWRTAARRFGFVEYDACVVETLDLLKRKAGEEIVNQIYAFTDKSGRELALRPEMTPSLARMVAARQGSLSLPIKWFTIAQCFRYERMTRGRKREHYQWNLDIVGENSVSAEAEIIACAVDALSMLGLSSQDVTVHFNSRALLSDMLSTLGIPTQAHPSVFMALDKRGKAEEAEIEALLQDAGVSRSGLDNIRSMLAIHSLQDASGIFNQPPESLRRLMEFQEILNDYGLRDSLKFDISIIRGLAYYTGIVFEACDTRREFRAIFGGGRYDNLLKEVGGQPASGVGLGFGDVVVAEILSQKNAESQSAHERGIAIGYMNSDQLATAMGLAKALRRKGTEVDLSLHAEKPKSFFSRAGGGHFAEAVYLGPDDLSSGVAKIKNLRTRESRDLHLQEVISGANTNPL